MKPDEAFPQRPIFQSPILMGQIDMPTAETQTTVGAAGGASALPATPSLYIKIIVNGTEYAWPVYPVS